MLKRIKVGTIIYLCLMCATVNAQEENHTVEQVEKKNVVKLNLSALAFRNISLQFERQIGKRTSIAAQVRTIPYGKLPFQSVFENIEDNGDVQFDQFKFGSFGIVPEFRFYLGKKGALHGFYIGPFLNYSNYKMDLPVNYTSGTTEKTGVFNGKLDAITGGIQFGSQFSLGKNIVLDWWIFGPNYGSADGTLNFIGSLTPQEQDDLRRELEDVKNEAPLEAIQSYNVTANGASVVVKGPWGGLRGGLLLGFRF